MTVRLNRIGNEIVVPLPREELSRMGLDEGSEVEVRVYREPRRFVITPVGEPPDVVGTRCQLRGRLAEQGERLKEKSDLLLKAMQERKVLEKLRERRLAEHRREIGKGHRG